MLASYAGVATVAVPVGAVIGAGIGVWRKLTRQDVALSEIHVLVNNRMTEALDRIDALETKLGLSPGEPIPSAAVVAPKTEGP